MTIFTVLLSIIFILNFILAGFIIFLERRDVGATWAWLLVLLFLPVIGFFLYLFFGQNLRRRKIFEWKDEEKIGIDKITNYQIQLLRDSSFHFNDYRTT